MIARSRAPYPAAGIAASAMPAPLAENFCWRVTVSGSGMKRATTRRAVGISTAAPTHSPASSPASPAASNEQTGELDRQLDAREAQARSSRFASYLRPVDGYIDGWIVDQESPDESITVALFIDQVEIATTVARLERPHLKKKFEISSSTHGFRVLVPNAYRDGKPHAVWLAVVGSNYRRQSREDLQIPATDVAPSLEIIAISDGILSGRLYGANDADFAPPELWIGSSLLGTNEAAVEWGPGDAAARTFRIVLGDRSAEELLVQSAQISVAHGWESGHGQALSSFVAPRVERISAEGIAIGAAIAFPVLDHARCRLELSPTRIFSSGAHHFTVDLSLGINDIILPEALRDGEFWARLLLHGASSPIELLAPTLVSALPATGGSFSQPGTAEMESGPVYVFNPANASVNPAKSGEIDPSVQLWSAGTETPRGQLLVAADDEGGTAFLRLMTDEAGDETRLRFVFSASDLKAGDFLHLRWFGRATALRPTDAGSKKIALSFSTDGTRSGEAWAEVMSARPDWRDHHTILRMQTVAEELAVEFTAPAGCRVDFGGLAVGKIANAADSLPQATTGTATVALADVLSYRIEQPLPAITPASYRRFGIVASLDSEKISGIAWSQESARRSTQLQLLVDGEMAGFASAEPFGSFDKGVSPGFFSAALPPAARDAQPHVIDVQFMGTRESLLGVPRALTVDSKHDGVAWLTPEGDVSGWAADPDEEAGPIQVEISVDGHPIGRVVADAQHPMFSDPAHNNGRCAFTFAIPPKFRDGRLHTITVRTTAGVELSGSPILAKVQKGRSTLHIDPTLSGWIKGWVVTRDPPAAASVVNVAVNGEFFGTIRAERSHDGGVAVGGARFRFSFRLPSHAAKVRLSAPELGVEVELEVVRVGHIDKLSPSVGFATTTERLYTEAKLALLAAPTKHIDADWYFAKYPSAAVEVANGASDGAAEHWLAIGTKRGWSPNPWFDERWYLARNPDAAAAIEAGQVEAGYLHWLAVGASEWRTPGQVFNPIDYRRDHPHADDTSVEETAFDVVHEWLADLADCQHTGNFPLKGAAKPTPPAPGRSLFRRAVTSRLDRTTIFDTHVGRLLEDLRVNAYGELEELRRTLDNNEVEIVRSVMEYEGLEEPLVSIIMPTFNRAYVIAEGIQSVLDQLWQNWELIICDDGSFDKTPKIVRQFTDPRIRYLQLEKSNGAVARNFGIKFSRGEYIAFLDSDNIWHPLFLTLAVNALRASSRPAVYSGYIDTNSNGARYTEAVMKFSPFDYLALVAKNYIDLNSLVVRRDLLEAFGTFDETLPRVQDWDLVLRLLRHFDPIEIPCAIAFYRRNPSWGQVTDLAAHTDFTKVVRQRALDRLRVQALVDTQQAPSVDLYASGSPITLETSLSFAKLLSGVTDVTVFLSDSVDPRHFPAHFDLNERIRLVRLHGQDRLSNHLAGGLLFVPKQTSGSELAGVPDEHPIIEFGWERERLVIRDRRNADDPGLTLGALRLYTPVDSDELHDPDAAQPERERTAAVLTIAPMRQRWIRALSRRGDKLQSTLYWHHEDQIHALQITDGQTKSESFNVEDGIRRIGRHATILLAAGTGEDTLMSTSLGIAAQRDGIVLVVGKDEFFENWASTKCAHLAPDDPDTAADLLIKVLGDTAASQRIKVRARRLFDYLYRSDVMKVRLSIVISLLNRSAGE